MQFDIHEGPQPSGPHWDSLRPVGEHLARELEFMADCLTVEDPFEELEGWALSIDWARWHSQDGKPLARVEILLGTGGPHVELNMSCSHSGNVERIELARYWSGASRAWTFDSLACDLADNFLSLVIPE